MQASTDLPAESLGNRALASRLRELTSAKVAKVELLQVSCTTHIRKAEARDVAIWNDGSLEDVLSHIFVAGWVNSSVEMLDAAFYPRPSNFREEKKRE